jgi:hypothetical protein
MRKTVEINRNLTMMIALAMFMFVIDLVRALKVNLHWQSSVQKRCKNALKNAFENAPEAVFLVVSNPSMNVL